MSTAADSTHRGPITLCVMLATIMQAIDTTIANVALPYMMGSLSATVDQINWVLTSYIIAAAIMMPPTGWLASRFGRKNFFLACVIGFTITSMLCGMAATLPQMVVFRLLQGVFGAALVPLSQAVLFDIYPKEQHGTAMAIFGFGVMVGPILGPTLGGWLTEAYGWRWVFYINLPVGILTFIGLSRFLSAADPQQGMRFDWFGFVMLSLAIGGLQLLLDRGEQVDWFASTEIIITAVVAGLGLYLFVVHICTAREPFIHPGIFTDRNYVIGLVGFFIMGIILLGTMALTTLYVQNLMGYPVHVAGLLMAPRGIGTMLAMVIVGRLVNRLDPRLLIAMGQTLLAWSLWDMAGFTPEVSVERLVGTGVLQGVGMGFVFVPHSTLTFATLPQHFRLQGTALYNLVRTIGSSIGISVLIFLLTRSISISHAEMVGQLTPFNDLLRQGGVALIWNLGTPEGRLLLNAEVHRQATIIAYANDFRVMMALSLATIPMLLLVRRPPRNEGPEPNAAVVD